MGGEVVRLSGPGGAAHLSLVKTRLLRIASIVSVIEAGEMLAALPECPIARESHLAALTLLASIEFELEALCAEISD